MNYSRVEQQHILQDPSRDKVGPQRARRAERGTAASARTSGIPNRSAGQVREATACNPGKTASNSRWGPSFGSDDSGPPDVTVPSCPGGEPWVREYRACAYRQAWNSQAVRSRGSSQFISAWADHLRASIPGYRTLWAFPPNRRGCKGLGQLDSLDSGPAGTRGSRVPAVRPGQHHRAEHLVLARLIPSDRNACPGPSPGVRP